MIRHTTQIGLAALVLLAAGGLFTVNGWRAVAAQTPGPIDPTDVGLAGKLQSADSPAVDQIRPWLDLTKATFAGHARKVDEGRGGVAFTFDMGTQRQNWTHNRWSVHMLDEPIDLSDFDAVLLEVATQKPRRDVGVYVALREADGSWYSHPWAVHLSARGGVNQGIARFADFSLPHHHSPPNGGASDANDRFDVDGITGVAIGVVNPLGVGEVEFTLRRLDLVKLKPEAAPEAYDVVVSGRLLDINNTTAVPSGLFGGFHLGENRHSRYRLAANRSIHHDATSAGVRLGDRYTPMHINTVGDRVRPSPRLTRNNWREASRNVGRTLGERSREAGRPMYVEYYNEPYLNWANFNRAGFIPRFFDESRAEEGGPVHIRMDGEVAPHLIWTRDRKYYLPSIFGYYDRRYGANLDHWRRGRTEDGRALSTSAEPYNQGMAGYYGGRWEPQSHPPRDVADGETYTYRNQTLTAFTPWHVVDTTQFTYWSGRGMLKFYIEPMLEVGRALKEANPDAVYIVGWGNRPSEDHWAGFHQLYKDTIDAGIDVIDGYNEHDYGGDPTNMGANYEVITAYGVIKHDKWLYAYNTETASSSDPQVYRDAAEASADVAKFEWVTRKMMHSLDYVPDKARVFLHFGDGANTSRGQSGWWSDKGEGIAMEMMINLRGRLLHVANDSPDLYVVASIDGTDDYAPRPEMLPDRKEMVVAIFNDRHQERKVNLNLQAPAGARLADGQAKFSRIVNGAVDVRTQAVAVRDNRVETSVTMGPRELRIITLPIANSDRLATDPAQWSDQAAKMVRRQHFGRTLLKRVEPGENIVEKIQIDADLLEGARRAYLSLVVQRLGHGDGVVTLNGHKYLLPGAVTPENTAWIIRVPVEVEHLKTENEMVISVAGSQRAGFFLCMSSIWVEAGPE
ncbi:MAG: hypothetical protein JJU36_12970 [Phycisphaeraceae bacterium]|nr:hypothetical protein [Phycisphaeraceae bacterium]